MEEREADSIPVRGSVFSLVGHIILGQVLLILDVCCGVMDIGLNIAIGEPSSNSYRVRYIHLPLGNPLGLHQIGLC